MLVKNNLRQKTYQAPWYSILEKAKNFLILLLLLSLVLFSHLLSLHKPNLTHTLCCIYLRSLAVYNAKCLCSCGQEWEGEGSHMRWRPCDWNLVMISSVASKCQDFKVLMPVFSAILCNEIDTSKFKVLEFWSQWRYHDQIQITRIKYWNACGNGPPPSFIPTLWNIGILHYK
jgi:hypothetical protein